MLFCFLVSPHLCLLFFFLIIRRPPRSTRTDTLFPYTTLFRSLGTRGPAPVRAVTARDADLEAGEPRHARIGRIATAQGSQLLTGRTARPVRAACRSDAGEIGRAHV